MNKFCRCGLLLLRSRRYHRSLRNTYVVLIERHWITVIVEGPHYNLKGNIIRGHNVRLSAFVLCPKHFRHLLPHYLYLSFGSRSTFTR